VTALLLILTMKDVDLLGIMITPMDNYMKAATDLTLKILSIMDRKVEVCQSDFRIANHNSGDHFIGTTISCNNFPTLINQKICESLVSEQKPVEFMARKIRQANQKVILNVTGPLHNVAKLLEFDPTIKECIQEIIFMGGAFDVEGNVHNKGNKVTHAEWNVYWDPVAAKSVIASGIKITMYTLDGNKQVPIKHELLKKMARVKSSELSKMIGTFFCQYEITEFPLEHKYFFLDPISVAHLAIDKLSLSTNTFNGFG